jgi:hypothetical protein
MINVPLELNPDVEATVMVPEPVMAVPCAMAEDDPVPRDVEAALNIFCPRAAIVLFAKFATIKTFSLDALV